MSPPCERGLPTSAVDDREVLSRAAHGDAAAFEDFVQRHEAALWRYARTLCDDDARAEDALQEAFVQAWRSAASFRGEGSARAWLFTIARNHVRRTARRARHAHEPGHTTPHETLAELATAAGFAAPADLGFAQRLDDRDEVLAALARLDAADRELVVLRDLEGHDNETVAALLGLGLAATKSRVHRARLRLLAELRRSREGHA